jgi:sec-independent protein translocase protein TatB
MFNIGPLEIIIVAVIALLVIGPDELPSAVRKAARFLADLRRFGEEVQHEVMAIIEDASSEEPEASENRLHVESNGPAHSKVGTTSENG